MKMTNSKRIINEDPYGITDTLELFCKNFSDIKPINEQNQIKFIVKKIILIRIILNENYIEDKWFLEGVYADLLSLLETLSLNKKRYFQFNLRSLIENMLRVLLNKKDKDKTGVRQLFYEAKTSQLSDSVSKLNNIYVKSNNFVHNNIESQLPLVRNYYELTHSKLKDKEISSMLKNLEDTCKVLDQILIITYYQGIDNIFHRRRKSLRRLIGENNYYKYFRSDKL